MTAREKLKTFFPTLGKVAENGDNSAQQFGDVLVLEQDEARPELEHDAPQTPQVDLVVPGDACVSA